MKKILIAFGLILVFCLQGFAGNPLDTIPSRTTLKTWFSKGKKPIESQFHQWIDAFHHLDEDTTGIDEVPGLADSLAAIRAVAESGGTPGLADSITAHRTDLNNLQAELDGVVDTVYKLNDTMMVVVYGGGTQDTLDVGGGVGGGGGTDDQTAAEVTLMDYGSNYDSTTVEGALAENARRWTTWNIVTDFGAIETDTLSDQTALNSAISLFESRGGYNTLIFPAGTYILDTTLNIYANNLKIVGAGKDSTILMADEVNQEIGPGQLDFIEIYGNNVTIENLSFDGRFSPIDWTYSYGVDGTMTSRSSFIYIDSSASNITLRDLRIIKTTRHGLDIRGNSVEVFGVEIDSTNSANIALSSSPDVVKGARDIYVHHCQFGFSRGKESIQIEDGSERVTFSNIKINCHQTHNGKARGINIYSHLDFPELWVRDVGFYNVKIDSVGDSDYAIRVTGGYALDGTPVWMERISFYKVAAMMGTVSVAALVNDINFDQCQFRGRQPFNVGPGVSSSSFVDSIQVRRLSVTNSFFQRHEYVDSTTVNHHGVVLNGVRNCWLVNNYIKGNVGDGIHIKDADTLRVFQNHIVQNGNDGIEFPIGSGANEIYIVGNNIRANTTRGIRSPNNATNVLIKDNDLRSNSGTNLSSSEISTSYVQHNPGFWQATTYPAANNNEIAYYVADSLTRNATLLAYQDSLVLLTSNTSGYIGIRKTGGAGSTPAQFRLRTDFGVGDFGIEGSKLFLGCDNGIAFKNFARSTTYYNFTTTGLSLQNGVTAPTAKLHLGAGTAAASTAPLKFTPGTNLTTPETGAMEWDGTNLFITQTSGPTRKTIAYTTDITGDITNGGNTGPITIGTNNTTPFHLEIGGTRCMSIPSSGIANTPSSTKALVLSSTDSLGYTTLQSSDWSNTVTQSGSDTLLNAAAGYGHFQRIGNIVSFTLRIEIALTTAGDANTVYISPPVASNFTTAASDVIGTATMDPQSLSGANTQRQRCVVFASDSDDKIGISFDPVASLAYPENRMYISVSGSYVVQ